jgi:hypothetical protein
VAEYKEPSHKEPSQLIGDFLREFSVLLFAFYILDDVLRGTFTGWGVFFMALASCALLWWGIILEGKDE